ncbi:ThiF family adenylyltransferase [Azoarcus sp. KH32C]|uniref:tRNA threonylcarbamoyladenosine dehydratase n=1 Tax=Azoarcus sp. KH32C TaxID=748247 RepID=UPI00023861BE|nr:tRNA threonylcarbamoyladenosine dehydratase [Azoarcus sp. KH32C]BAL26226.1 hypothetical protein AZKH_3942 [Azoarcus sp. KH32C]
MSGISPELVPEVDRERRFGGMARLYGPAALPRLQSAHACVIGVGGVGSWVAEALARSGIGRITLIDLDHVAESNINRQIHALDATLGQAKVEAMAARIRGINPEAKVVTIDDFVTPDNAEALIEDFDVVVDAIDNVRAKVAIVLACRARRIPLIVAGGAGGKTDPRAICVADLSRTEQDPLLAKVRKRLRAEHGFPRNPKRPFGIEAVYSTEPLRLGDLACDLPHGPQGLACAGYGSSMMVTASVGLFAAARAIERLLAVPVDASKEIMESVV